MNLLLIDIGNTRVKWARLKNGRMGKQHAATNTGWSVADYERILVRAGRGRAGRGRAGRTPAGATRGDSRDRVVVSSVAGTRVNRMLVSAARRAGAPAPEFVMSKRSAAGVTTAYLEPWRLGVDRFVAAIGAHHLASGNPVCIVNVGTAMTIDLVDGQGGHRGGAILPGPVLMVNSLLQHTSGIRRRARGGANGGGSLFARATRAAIRQGSLYAAAAVIDRAIDEATREVGGQPLVILTGGGSAAVKPLVRGTCVSIPELVLHGLAVWASKHPPGGPGPGGSHSVNRRRGKPPSGQPSPR